MKKNQAVSSTSITLDELYELLQNAKLVTDDSQHESSFSSDEESDDSENDGWLKQKLDLAKKLEQMTKERDDNEVIAREALVKNKRVADENKLLKLRIERLERDQKRLLQLFGGKLEDLPNQSPQQSVKPSPAMSRNQEAVLGLEQDRTSMQELRKRISQTFSNLEQTISTVGTPPASPAVKRESSTSVSPAKVY